MSDDFLRLVSQANPAARQQYDPASGNAYPPHAGPSSPNNMDPFFDDDNESLPDSTLAPTGPVGPMQSTDSAIPLARAGVNPAGHSKVTVAEGGVPQGWNFDDDDLQPSGTFAGSDSFNGVAASSSNRAPKPPKKRVKWEWPWNKQKVYVGERVVALNTPDANAEFPSNSVSTSKYNVATFLPKFLLGASPVASPFA